ncbi:hypothetical protein DUI87_03849 [Hirundo rustica rustica]|uniref:Reverse transcriptase domain-containing protein n=1 Tax=Hirundo rustica rustica TaxID=333673 RepID=A0A3M0L1M0_HIRRU|nr:hypothetical protein DUI87_03849 [Hirundo rustica rustica]
MSHSWSTALHVYKLFRRDRQGIRGGGVALYIKKAFDTIGIETNEDGVECLWVRIKGKANKADILLGVCYRPPNQEEEVDNLLYQQLENVSGSSALVLSRLTGKIPDDWKLANVTPIHKKDRKEDPSNYRPVSLTSVPGKIMEQFILSVITQNLQDGQGLRPSQHGFRRDKLHSMKLLATPLKTESSLQGFTKALLPEQNRLEKIDSDGETLSVANNRRNLQRDGKFGLATLFNAIVPDLDFLDVKVHILSDQSGVRNDPRAINQLVPIA